MPRRKTSRRKKARRKKSATFTQKDFNSGEGMLTTVWGPALWHILHVISFNYPTKPTQRQKKDYRNFFLSLEKVLPCRYCRENFPMNCSEAGFCPDVFKNRKSFSRFIYKLHCKVNQALGKRKCETFSEVRDRYEHFRARCQKPGQMIRKESRKTSRKRRVEKGCVQPQHGKMFRCVIDVVPDKSARKSFKLCSRNSRN